MVTTERERTAALTNLVGQSRAYLLQLDLAKAELEELHESELAPLVAAITDAEQAVRYAERLGTAALRAGQ
jgi:hypothetical protein